MVAESHRYVSSFSKLTFGTGLGSILQSPLADQETSRIAAELEKNVNEKLEVSH